MKAFLALQNGTVFEGESIGASGETIGEIVFTTGMSGYQEVLTDASFAGQIITMTYPLIGNYGINSFDSEADKPVCKGFVVHELCTEPNNFRTEETLDTFLKKNNIIGIQGIDTRKLTKIIRSIGAMNGIISTDSNFKIEDHIEKINAYFVDHPVNDVTTKTILTQKPQKPIGLRVVIMDFGVKNNIINSLLKRGCETVTVPAYTSYEGIMALKPDGIMLTNGPGNPKDCMDFAPTIRKLFDSNIPMFAICLGHQLLLLALGGNTVKMKFGHHGGNHPVKDVAKDRVYITSQNHGYAVEADTISNFATITHINMNDNTIEGIKYNDKPITSVQFHPEACPGPQDTDYLFDEFIDTLKKYSVKKN